jgi:hypothetical protein
MLPEKLWQFSEDQKTYNVAKESDDFVFISLFHE